MPEPLVILRPEKKPLSRELAVIGTLLLPVLCFTVLILRKIELHFDNTLLNLSAHAFLLFVMPLLFQIYSQVQPEFKENGEFILAEDTYLSSFRYTWWMLLMVWPAFFLGVFMVGDAVFSSLLSGNEISTPGWGAAATFVVSFLVAKFYWHLITMRQQVRVSDAGLRTGLTHFLEWETIHRVSRFRGRYEVFIKASPKLPFCAFVTDKQNAQLFENFLSRHSVSQSNVRYRFASAVKGAVAAGAAVILAAGVAVYVRGLLDPVAALSATFGLGIFATYSLEKVRNIKALTPIKPVFELPGGETNGLDPEKVPETLRDLVPLAEKWGIADDAIRSYNSRHSTKEEKLALKYALEGRTAAISEWLETFKDAPPCEEAESFWRMLDAYNRMKLWLMPDG